VLASRLPLLHCQRGEGGGVGPHLQLEVTDGAERDGQPVVSHVLDQRRVLKGVDAMVNAFLHASRRAKRGAREPRGQGAGGLWGARIAYVAWGTTDGGGVGGANGYQPNRQMGRAWVAPARGMPQEGPTQWPGMGWQRGTSRCHHGLGCEWAWVKSALGLDGIGGLQVVHVGFRLLLGVATACLGKVLHANLLHPPSPVRSYTARQLHCSARLTTPSSLMAPQT
jgi:hypothetical protein